LYKINDEDGNEKRGQRFFMVNDTILKKEKRK